MAKKHVLSPEQRIYIPLVAIERATQKHSWSRLPVAVASRPDQACGEARRIGYTGREEHDLALYRLKIKPGGLPTMTLPGIYIIDEGMFQDYEEWKASQEPGLETTIE